MWWVCAGMWWGCAGMWWGCVGMWWGRAYQCICISTHACTYKSSYCTHAHATSSPTYTSPSYIHTHTSPTNPHVHTSPPYTPHIHHPHIHPTYIPKHPPYKVERCTRWVSCHQQHSLTRGYLCEEELMVAGGPFGVVDIPTSGTCDIKGGCVGCVGLHHGGHVVSTTWSVYMGDVWGVYRVALGFLL